MNSQEDKNRATRSHPLESLESPFLDEELFVRETENEWEARAAALAAESPFLRTFESRATEPEAEEESYGWEHELEKGLHKKLKHLSLLPHFVEWGHKESPLDPGLMNPGFYDGTNKYKFAPRLQDCLNAVMKKKQFSHIKVALVDLTKSNSQPEFAGVHHTDQVRAANIPKLAAMLAAFQLRHDLRVALQKKGVDKLRKLFEQVRDDWALSQINPHRLVLAGKSKVDLVDPKSPQLEYIFAAVPPGDPVTIEFSSTGEDPAQLEVLADAFRDAKSGSEQKLDALGFMERLRLMMTGKTRASNYVTSTVVRDLGYLYIASTLLQSGLYDPKRGGGLWLGADYARGKWRGPLAGGDPRSANAGSLAAFLTLLVQDSLVDPQSSADMLTLIEKDPTVSRTTLGFMPGFLQLRDQGSIVTVHGKRGVDEWGMDEYALIARQVDTAAGKDSVRYIAVGLRAKTLREMENLIVELDKCILTNNELKPVQGGHADQHELEYRSDEEGPLPEAAEWDESAFGAETEPEFSRESPFLSEEELGIIGGQDDRVRVRDTLAVPFRWICRIWVQRRVITPGHEENRGLAPAGTGLLISPRHVLTAAHVLHGVEERGSVVEEHKALHVEVAPAADGDLTPFGRIEAISWDLPPNWKPTSRSSQFDYAVITLKEAVGERTLKKWKGGSLCFWGSPTCGANTSLDAVPSALAKKLIGVRVLTGGFPTAKKGEMWCAAGKLSAGSATDAHLTKQGIVEDWAKKAGTFFLTADASEGQSGSPVWIVHNGKRYLVGLLVSIGERNNTALNLREAVVRQIQSWTGIVGKSFAEPEEYVQAVARRSPLRIPEGAEWSGEAEEPETFGEAEDEFGEDRLELLHEQPLEERFDPAAIPPDVADALGKKTWPLALKLAIQAGWRDENDLTNLIFFARHQELPPEKLDPKDPKFKQLSDEWTKILNIEVWKAIQASAENTDLVVSGEEVTDHHRRFFKGKSGKRLRKLVEDAAREVDLNPGLLGTIMMAETRRPQSYLSSEKVSSYHIGADDFYEGRAAIKARVPAYAKVGWDRNQTPVVHDNDSLSCRKKAAAQAAGDKALFEKYSKLCRQVKTILFNSGPDAVLATAVYLKFYEVRLREVAAAELNGDFDKLPLATRFALSRMAMASGINGAKPCLEDALKGEDIFIRKAIPVKIDQTKRNATVRTAQAVHLSDWVFGIPVPAAAAQPELEMFEDFERHEFEGTHEDMGSELTEEVWHPDHESEDGEPTEIGGKLQDELSRDDPYSFEVELEEHEFRLSGLPAKAQQHFSKGAASWRDAVAEAIRAGIRNPNHLAEIIFFMHHPERMSTGVGKPISINEPEFFKLRAEWELCRTIAKRRLTPSTACSVFLPAIRSWKYEDYVAAPTTGRITLMLNGRNSRGSGDIDDRTEALNSMQETVESLGRGDCIFLAAWQLKPTAMDLTGPSPASVTNWGELFVRKASEGVKIRIIMSDMPPDAVGFESDVNDLKTLVDKLPGHERDNLKYIVSMHPAKLPGPRKFDPKKLSMGSVHVGTHHQKLMVVKKGKSTIAYCGGLDLSPPRTPKGWLGFLVWHDTHAKLEGLITRDLEREFILRWNREKDKSTAPKHPGWKAFESLAQAPLDASDKEARKNTHKLQMLRTVSVGAIPRDIKRDDIWQGYFRLIGCATRFLFMENQYFFEPKLADAIVKQAEAQPGLIVIIVVSFETDDLLTNAYTKHGRALQNEFFTRLFAGVVPSKRLRVYTMFGRLVHSKLILVDDQFLSVGSANANPRGFFLDTELNVMLDDAEAVKGFRHKLWTHNLGALPGKVATWGVQDFIAQWDVVAQFNEKLKKTPHKMVGESVIPFDPRTVKGERAPYIPDVLSER